MNQKTKQHAHKHVPTHRPPHAQPEDDSPMLWVRHLGKSLLISAGTGVLLTVILSLIAYFYPDPDKLIFPLGIVASALTAFIGGFAAVKLHGHSALLCGLLNGSLFTALMILASLFFTAFSAGHSAWLSCLLHVGFLLLSVAGSYIGLNFKSNQPKKRKR